MALYQEFKAINFLKHYIYSFIYLKAEYTNDFVYLYPDGADYLLYDNVTIKVIKKNFIKQSYKLCLKENTEYFLVRLKPCSFYFFEQDIIKYNQTLITLEQMMQTTKSFSKKKKLIELLILELTNANQQENNIVSICNIILQKKGNITLTDLSHASNIHPRTLQREFKKIIQLTPKEFINIIKFQNTLSTLYAKINQDKIVKIDPYYDYSHFYKTFKKYLNISPKELKKANKLHIKSIFNI